VSLRRDGAVKRERILDAALACFAARGVLGVGIEDVRRAADASPSSVYHYFGDLNDLTLALLTRTFERLFAHLAARVLRARTARGSVKRLVSAHLAWIAAHPEEGRFMYQATALEFSPAAGAALQAAKANMLAPVVAHLRPFMERGELPAWSPLVFDVVVLGPSHEACRRALAGAPLDGEWMRGVLPDLAWRTVRAELRRVRRRPLA